MSPNNEIHSLKKLTAQYFQQLDLPHLSLPNAATIVRPDIQCVIYEHMFNEAALWPLPPVGYRTRVLKTIVSRIEEGITDPEEDELNSDLIETWTSLISLPKPSQIQQAQKLTYIKYTAPTTTTTAQDSQTVITSESRGLIYSSGTTGFRTWEASLHLGTYLSTSAGATHVTGKRVIELGAGTGFVSMYAAKYLRPQFVLATDREGTLIENMTDSKAKNGLGREFGVSAWEWGTPLGYPTEDDTEDIARERLCFDVALGADLTYDTDLLPLLFATLHDLFDNYGVQEFILSATLRNQKTFQAFLDACGMCSPQDS
ncbi:putative methyltransferase-domain-containing protein [Aspergillus bertholletiae]|uniref:Putative methyltransferase-domain-containing protein n=1 Tax=Aspergillus bertholletiae TaxID=1226010 RepID=A0A5N7B795_9EURO|nr:putative methyltransferase-domain-containing protein [Aspergillus bertholletiae]